jgi:transposase
MQIRNDNGRVTLRGEAVQALLQRKFHLQVSGWTVGRYLRASGLAPRKPSAF